MKRYYEPSAPTRFVAPGTLSVEGANLAETFLHARRNGKERREATDSIVVARQYLRECARVGIVMPCLSRRGRPCVPGASLGSPLASLAGRYESVLLRPEDGYAIVPFAERSGYDAAMPSDALKVRRRMVDKRIDKYGISEC